jgi:hypothetical protein
MNFANPQRKTRILATNVGHVLEFPPAVDGKLVFVHVPPEATGAAVAAGFVPEEDLPEEVEKSAPQRPAADEAMVEAVFDAFEKLVNKAERDDFNGAGMPHAASVSAVLGWPVSKAEVKDLWSKFQAAKAST